MCKRIGGDLEGGSKALQVDVVRIFLMGVCVECNWLLYKMITSYFALNDKPDKRFFLKKKSRKFCQFQNNA